MRIPNAISTALTVFLGATAAIWLATNWAGQVEAELTQVRLIKAELGPVKQRPLDRKGLSFPNQNMLVFGLLEIIPPPPRQVTLAPLPEEPVELPMQLSSAIEKPVLANDQVSRIKDLKDGEVRAELQRMRLAFLAGQSSGSY